MTQRTKTGKFSSQVNHFSPSPANGKTLLLTQGRKTEQHRERESDRKTVSNNKRDRVREGIRERERGREGVRITERE